MATPRRQIQTLAISEKWLATVLVSVGDAVLATDGEGRVTFMNPVAEALTGWTLEEAWGEPLHLVFHIVNERTRRPVASPVERALREGAVVGLANHTLLLRRDGSEIAIDDSAAPIRDEQGAVTGAVLIFRDVTAQRRAELEIEERTRQAELGVAVCKALISKEPIRRQLQRCVEAIVPGLDVAFARIWTLNAEEEVLELQASAGLYTHTDGPHGRVPVGAFKIGLIAQERAPHLTNEVLNDPRVSDKEWARREGMIAFAGYPLMIEDRLVGVLALFARHALTVSALQALASVADQIALAIDRAWGEEALRQSELRYRQASEFEQQILGIVSHDLRNPLSIISLSSTLLLERDGLDERGTQVVRRIQSSADRAARMIRDLLDFTQARLGGGIPVHPRPVDLHSVVRQVVEETRTAFPEREIELEQRGPGAGTWDADRLAQVLSNLVANALNYSPRDTGVSIRTNGDTDTFELEVRNGGEPIPAEVLPTLFRPMQRGANHSDRSARSVGLGLYIVREIVTAHGGEVSLSSTPADGTAVRVRLPRS